MRQGGSSSQLRLRAAAKALFAKRGYEGTAISDITSAAGTSHSQFLKYYSGKQQLRREIIDEQWAELTKSVVLAAISVSSPAEKLRLALNMFISFLEGDPQFRAILLLEQMAIREKGTATVSHAFREFVAVIDDILNAMRTTSQLINGIEIQALRSALLGLIEGMMRDQLVSSADFPAQYPVEQVRSMLSVMLDSVCEFQRPSTEARTLASGELGAGAEDDWIRYYLKLADKALQPEELS